MNKCGSCQYRKNIPGDAHSSCEHPEASFYSWLYVMSLPELTEDLVIPPLNIRANIYAIKKGWFMWPINFDPAWLESCDGYKEKDDMVDKETI